MIVVVGADDDGVDESLLLCTDGDGENAAVEVVKDGGDGRRHQ